MSPYTHKYKEEDARLISAELSSNRSDNSLEGKLQKNVSFNKFKPTDITIFIDKQDEVVPALHSNMTLDSEKPKNRARLMFIITLLFILLLVCIVIISAVRQFTSGDDESFDHTNENMVYHYTSKNHTVFSSTTLTALLVRDEESLCINMFFTCRKGDTSPQDDTVSSINGKRTPSSSVSTRRASSLSIVALSRLLSKGPSQKSRALLFALAILLVTITCLVFLLGVRIIRGDEDRGQLGKILNKMLDTLSSGHSNRSDTSLLRNTTTINSL